MLYNVSSMSTRSLLLAYYPVSRKTNPYDTLELLHKTSLVIIDFCQTGSLVIFPTDCRWNWYGARPTCGVSIETVSPLQDSWPAEPTHSLAVEFMRQETPGFTSSELWLPNSRKFIQIDQSTRSGAAYRTACTRSQTFLGSRPRLADLEQTIVDKRYQRRKRLWACVKANKRQHYDTMLWLVMPGTVWKDTMSKGLLFQTAVNCC